MFEHFLCKIDGNGHFFKVPHNVVVCRMPLLSAM